MNIPFAEIGLGGAGLVCWAVVLMAFLAIFALTIEKRFALLRVARGPADRFSGLGERFVGLLRDGLGQGRMPRQRYALTGRAHILVFWGFLVLGIRTLTLMGQGFFADFNLPLLAPDGFLGRAYLGTKDLFVLLVLLGIAAMAINRLVLKPWRLTFSAEATFILGLIATLMITDLLMDGAMHRLSGAPFHWYGLNGWWVASILPQLSETTLRGIVAVNWWIHVIVILVFMNLLPISKHFHVITALPNVFLRNTEPPGRLPTIDFEDESLESYGKNKITEYSWKNVLDWYTCTECGRCSSSCPATLTSKPLSPKHLTTALRDHLYEHGPAAARAAQQGEKLPEDDPIEAEVVPTVLKNARSPLAEALKEGEDWDPAEVIWSCNTCRACEVQCPVHIEYVELIIDLRRYQVMMNADFPSELKETFKGMENNYNPWGIGYDKREEWAEGLDIRVLKEGEEAPEYLFFVGCAGAFDDRSRKVSRALTKILKHADIDFAILGCRERCTGDSARRAGNEYLFDQLARDNVELFTGHKVKKVVTACPHCCNALKHEYRDYGLDLEVVHHSELIAELVQAGRLELDGDGATPNNVVFHDSCYLGRYNDVYDAPRLALSSTPGVQVKEARLNRRDAMCCGAGGARMWVDEEVSQRVNLKRFEQLQSAGAETIGVSCPFCMTMLDDAMKHHDLDSEMQVLDIAEVVAERIS